MNLLDTRNNLIWKDYLQILYKRKWWVLVPFVVTVAIGLFISMSKKPVYQSSSMIKISENVDFSQAMRKILPGVGARRGSADVRQIAKEMVSTKYVDKLIDRLGLKPEPKILEQANEIHEEFPQKDLNDIVRGLQLDMLKSKIHTKSVGRDMIDIKVSGPDPETCYLANKALIDVYLEESTEVQLVALKNASKFSNQQIGNYKIKLDEAEKRLEKFNQNISMKKVDDKKLENIDIKRFEEASASIDLHLDELEKSLTKYSNVLNSKYAGKTPPETPIMANIQDKINDNIDKIASLMYQFEWKDPQLIKLNAEIDDYRMNWKREVERSYRVILNRAELKDLDLFVEKSLTLFDIDNWTRRKRSIGRIVNSYKQYVAEEPVNKQVLSKLEDEVEQTKNIYNTLVEQDRGSKLKEAMERADLLNRIKVLEPPRKPIIPLSSGTNMALAMTMFLAFALSIGSVFTVEYMDKSIRTVEEAELEFNIPVIGVVSNLNQTTQA